MKTQLDQIDAKWFLKGIVFQPHGLLIFLAEAIAGEEETIELVGVEVEGSRPLGATDDSHRFEVRFERVLAHSVVHEAFTVQDDYEQRDDADHAVEILSQSRFLDHLHDHHGWLFEIEPDVRHYRVWTYNAVVDVAATHKPEVTPR